MASKKLTKGSLVASMISLLMCFAMLLGTTFAWFTDNDSAVGNEIKSGNLNVELVAEDGKTELKEALKFVKDEGAPAGEELLWEPGVTYVTEKFKVANKGNLALKYKLAINGVDGDSDLLEVIDFYLAKATDIDTAISLDSDTDSHGQLSPNETSDALVLVGHMKEEAGNEYMDKTLTGIGITVYATQWTEEYDSFNYTYDEDAEYDEMTPSTSVDSTGYTKLEDIIADLEADGANGVVQINLTNDVTWTTGAGHGSTPVLTADSAITTLIIDGNGYTLTADGDGVGSLRAANGGKLIFRDLTIDDESVSYAENAWEFTYLEFAGNLEFENCEFTSGIQLDLDNGSAEGVNASFVDCDFDSPNASEYSVWIGHGTVSFEDCTFTGTRGAKIHEAYGSDVTEVTFTDCEFYNIEEKPGVVIGDLDATTVVTIEDSTFVDCKDKAGDVVEGVDGVYESDTASTQTDEDGFTLNLSGNSAAVAVSNKTELTAAIDEANSGDIVRLNADVDLGATQLAVEKAITIDLGGNTITADNGWGIISLKNGASIANGTVDVNTNVAAIRAFNAGSIKNMTINVDPKATDKVTTGIAVQKDGYVGTIENVTITGASQGIEVYKGATVDLIDSVNVEADSNGTADGIALQINAGYVGKAVDSTFDGEAYGVHMMLNGEYDVALELEDCDVSGDTYGIYAHDEKGISNTTNCSLTLTYGSDTTVTGGTNCDFEDECLSVVTLNIPD